MLNWILALVSAALLILTFPRFHIVWFAPVALTPLLVALAREARPWRRFLLGWTSGVVYWCGVCYWIQFVLAFHGGVGDALGWMQSDAYLMLAKRSMETRVREPLRARGIPISA